MTETLAAIVGFFVGAIGIWFIVREASRDAIRKELSGRIAELESAVQRLLKRSQ